MEKNYYYIPATEEAPFAAMGEFLSCRHCKRKILVEMGINGTIHHMGTSAVCADCLVIREEFRQKFPDVTRQIEEWKNAKADS
jgi:hypothetical protein